MMQKLHRRETSRRAYKSIKVFHFFYRPIISISWRKFLPSMGDVHPLYLVFARGNKFFFQNLSIFYNCKIIFTEYLQQCIGYTNYHEKRKQSSPSTNDRLFLGFPISQKARIDQIAAYSIHQNQTIAHHIWTRFGWECQFHTCN